MTILYATDHRSYIVGNSVYLSAGIYPILKRYADNFGKIILYSRFAEVEEAPIDAVNTDFIIDYVKVHSLMQTLISNEEELLAAVKKCDLVVGRIPSIPSYKAIDYARQTNTPYLTEAMGCAWDAYWNHGIIGKIIAPYMFLKMRNLIKNADYATYVTSEFLQSRYPRSGSSLSASNVLLAEVDSDVLKRRIDKIKNMSSTEVSLMTTAAVNVRYKGQEFVIKAIPGINKKGIRIKYYIVGDGNQDYLRNIANKAGVADQVVFTGRLILDDIFSLLDNIDIYVQPSLQEGLPRAVIEAMSRGCLVVGANTAGIPELLDNIFVTRRRSISDIQEKIVMICNSSMEHKIKYATRNFEKSKEYLSDVLDKRRSDYYHQVIQDLRKLSE